MAKKYLLETWREIAYNQEQTQKQYNEFWAAYFAQEKEVYKDILSNHGTVVSGTVEELAEKYNMEVLTMVGFLDGINESLKKENPIDKLTETTLLAVAVLIVCALLTLIFAFMGNEAAWKASAYCMVIIPIMIYIMMWLAKLLENRG